MWLRNFYFVHCFHYLLSDVSPKENKKNSRISCRESQYILPVSQSVLRFVQSNQMHILNSQYTLNICRRHEWDKFENKICIWVFPDSTSMLTLPHKLIQALCASLCVWETHAGPFCSDSCLSASAHYCLFYHHTHTQTQVTCRWAVQIEVYEATASTCKAGQS